MGYPPDMDYKYFWYLLAGLGGGYVFRVRRPETLSAWSQFSHLVAGGICAVYGSPVVINFYNLGQSEGQYLVPFVIGAFWWKFFEALELSLGSIKFPWSK